MGAEHSASRESPVSSKSAATREHAPDRFQGLDLEGQVPPTHASLLSLQRLTGNQAVQRLLSRQTVVGGKGATTEDEGGNREPVPASGGKGASAGDRWAHRQAIDAFQRQNPEDRIVAGQRQLLGAAAAGGTQVRDYSPTIRRKGKADTAAAGGAPALTKKTVSGPTTNPYGKFKWVVQWELDKPSPKGGSIVQSVNANHTITKTDGSKAGTGFDAWVPYWEAWQVKKGQKITTYAQKGDVEDDTFSKGASPAGSTGTFEEIGSAAFYEGLKLPSSLKANPKSPAGILPFSQSDPGVTGGSAALAHTLKAVWDGVGGDGSTTVTTV
jgi:hypothetical protein